MASEPDQPEQAGGPVAAGRSMTYSWRVKVSAGSKTILFGQGRRP